MQLFADISSSYYGKSYPAVVEYSERFEKYFSDSQFLPQILVLKGESLFHLNRFSEAEKSLHTVLNFSNLEENLVFLSNYWLGKIYFTSQDFNKAIDFFYNAAFSFSKINLEQQEKLNSLYMDSLLNAAFSYYENKLYMEAIPLFEDLIQRGNKLLEEDYYKALISLFDSYNQNKDYDKFLLLYNTLKKNQNLSISVLNKIKFLLADNYILQEEYLKAYDVYLEIMMCKEPAFVSLAFQNAYNLSILHRKEIKKDPGEILQKIESSLSDNKELLLEFWTRLGIDSYHNEDYVKAKKYFSNAQLLDLEKKYLPLIALYHVDMENINSSSLLLKYIDECKISEESDFYFDYQFQLCRYYLLEEKYDEGILLCKKNISLLENSAIYKFHYEHFIYFYSYCLYKNKNFDEAFTVLKKYPLKDKTKIEKINYSANILYAKILQEKKLFSDARHIYELFSSSLKDEDRLDYARLLFLEGYINSSLKQCMRINNDEVNYLIALCYFNLREWNESYKYFSKYISSSCSENYGEAKFYSAYCMYKLNQNVHASNLLSEFILENPNHNLLYTASIIQTNALLKENLFEDACNSVEQSLNFSKTKQESENSILMASSIFIEQKKYEKAISILLPHVDDKSSFAVEVNFLLGEIYEKQGNILMADKTFSTVEKLPYNKDLSEEASYRRGEMYFIKNDYATSLQRFLSYQKKYPFGKFIDNSYFYIAESYRNQNQFEKAILYYKSLIQSNPNSPFVYNSYKSLFLIYKDFENYAESEKYLNILLDLFPEESKKDNLLRESENLKTYFSQENSTVAKALNRFNENKGLETLQGRIAGTDLVEQMLSSQNDKNEAYSLAKELFILQTKKINEQNESQYACRTGYIYAQSLQEKNKNQEAANLYLVSAKYARKNSNHQLAMKALYSSVENFIIAGLEKDAQLVYENLCEWYPDSEYTKSSINLFKKY